jgi:hypothetical protein
MREIPQSILELPSCVALYSWLIKKYSVKRNSVKRCPFYRVLKMHAFLVFDVHLATVSNGFACRILVRYCRYKGGTPSSSSSKLLAANNNSWKPETIPVR